jgi:hypothetical protein
MKMADFGVGAGTASAAPAATIGLRLPEPVAQRLARYMKEQDIHTVSRACRELVDEALKGKGY